MLKIKHKATAQPLKTQCWPQHKHVPENFRAKAGSNCSCTLGIRHVWWKEFMHSNVNSVYMVLWFVNMAWCYVPLVVVNFGKSYHNQKVSKGGMSYRFLNSISSPQILGFLLLYERSSFLPYLSVSLPLSFSVYVCVHVYACVFFSLCIFHCCCWKTGHYRSPNHLSLNIT